MLFSEKLCAMTDCERAGKSSALLLCQGIFLFHVGTQVYYTSTNISHNLFPSKTRSSFTQEFGFPIRGTDEDIKKHVGYIPSVLHKENEEYQFTLQMLEVRSDKYVLQSIDQQIDSIIGFGNIGYYWHGTVVVDVDATSSTLHHEIKHAKAEEINRIHPEFKARWMECATNGGKEKVYLTSLEEFCSRYRGLQSYVPKEKQNHIHNETLGFVRTYGRTNIDEDIATLCEYAECRSNMFIRWLYDKPNQKIISKVQLAEKYGLLPTEFSEYIWLEKLYYEGKWELYRELSDYFFGKHHHSIYDINVRRKRGLFLEDHSPELAIEEYKKGLAARYKEPTEYQMILTSLRELYEREHNKEKVTLYNKANQLYSKRQLANDMQLPLQGVNGYLITNGEI